MIFCSFNGISQHRCITQKPLIVENNFQNSDRRLAQSIDMETLIIIPVVIHVIHNNSSGAIGGIGNSNISEEQILSQIQALNEDYQKNQVHVDIMIIL